MNNSILINYGSVDMKIKNRILVDSIFLILASIMFLIFIQIGSTFDQKLYPGLLILEMLLFIKVNDFKLININSAFVGCLTIYFLFGPIVYMLEGRIVETNLFIINIAFILYIFGIFFNKKLKFKKHLKTNIIKYNGVFDSKVSPFVLYFISCFASFYYIFINRNFLFSNLETGRVEAMSGNGILLLLIKCFIVSVPMLYSEYKKNKISKSIFWTLLICSIFLTFSIGYKASSLTICIVIALMYCRYEKLLLKKIIKILFLCFLLIFFFDFIRASFSDTKFNLLEKVINNMSVGFYNYERIVYWFPKNKEYQFGYTFLINLKMLLPGPDLDFTLWLKETLQMNFAGGGTVPTIFGELYLNFSFIGVFLGMIIIGFLSESISYLYKREGFKWYICLISWQFIHSVTGGFSNTIVDTLLLLGIGFFISLLEKRTGD